MKPVINFFLIACILSACISQKRLPEQFHLKVMTYNVHHCNPPSKPGLIDIDAIAHVIKTNNADIVALQEIDVNTKRSGNINQAKIIKTKTGYPYYYFAKAIDFNGGDYGVMILSKFPLSDSKTYQLPTDVTTNGEPRVLALTTVTLPDNKKILFGCTHLDAQGSPVNRVLQAKEINRIAAAEKLPVIIAGDLNAVVGSEPINILDEQFSRTCKNCAPTIPEINPKKAIDFIAFKPLHQFLVLRHHVVTESYASDHLPVMAHLQIKF